MTRLNRVSKRIICVILSFAVIITGAIPFYAVDAEGLTGDVAVGARIKASIKVPGTNITATLSGNTLTVSGSGAIPSNAFASDVTRYGNLKNVTKIVIKDSITEIGPYAFSGCVNTTSLTLNSKLKTIRLGAFWKCTKLKSAIIPAGVTHVQDGAFQKKYTVLALANGSKMKAYGINGYRCYDNLTINVFRDYDKAFIMKNAINNMYRKGKTTLKMDYDLMEVAMERAAELIALFSHTRPNGEECFTIYGGVSAEVIGRGGSTASKVLSELAQDKTNKTAIQGTSWKSVGVGCIQYNGVYYWVILFGTSSARKNSNGNRVSGEAASPTNFTAKTALEFSVGTNKITKVDNGKSSSYTHNFKFNTATLRLIKGEKFNASLKLGGIEFYRANTKWSSTKSSVAKVSSSGVITAMGAGTAKIKAGSTLTNRATLNVIVSSLGRLAGSDRLGTAFKVSEGYMNATKQTKLNNVIVVNGMNFPDALSASYLSTTYKAPIIMTNGSASANTAAVNWVKKNMNKNKGKVYFVGGTFVLPNGFKNQFQKAGYKVGRVAGADRLGTNIAVLKNVGVSTGSEVLVCDGFSFHNALIASATGKPLLMVGTNGLTTEQKNFLKSKTCKFTILGNTKSVSSKVEQDLKIIGTTTRVLASNPDAMSVAVAKKYWPQGPTRAFMATSNNFPDALAGGPVCIAYNAPIFLVNDKSYSNTRKYLQSCTLTSITSLGGTLVVPDSLAKKAGGF